MQIPPLPYWLRNLYFGLFAVLPWSVEWPLAPGWNLTAPSEPLIATTGLGLLVVLWRHGRLPTFGFFWVPVLYMAWQGLMVLCSTLPLVSVKYYVVEAGQWLVFYAGLALWPALWPRLIRVFSYSLAGVVVYAVVHHAFFHFRADQAILAPMPFFSDHTVFSAVVAMALLSWGLLRALGLDTEPHAGNTGAKASAASSLIPRIAVLERVVLPALFVLALGLIASRAAWLSLLLAGFAGAVLYFRKQWRWFLLAACFAAGAGWVFRAPIGNRLQADVSSMERLNRYACALRMANDRPWTGFGPGTYQFQYLRYQRPEEMTRLSITEPIARREFGKFGRGGGAHSEYFQALSETGWPGLACWLALVAGSLLLAIRLYLHSGRLYWLFLGLSVFSFFLHGLVNNFLHDARVAALVWGQLGVVCSNFIRNKRIGPV